MPIKASAPLAFLCEKIVPIISTYESLTLMTLMLVTLMLARGTNRHITVLC